jgi:hypothetical protein
MDLHRAQAGDAVELPEGMFTLAALTRWRGTALEWSVWELQADDSGTAAPATAPPQLAIVGEGAYRVGTTAAPAMPGEETVSVDSVEYRLRQHGEVRGERNTRDGKHTFWLGQYRCYLAEGRVLLFTEVHGDLQRLAGEAMDARLISIYE